MPVTRPRRTFRPDAVLVQAAIAGALSFAHLHDIADAAGQHGWKAWAYPVSVDLLLVAAWNRMRTLRTTDRPAGTAWTWFAIALAASLGANVATAGLLDLDRVPAWLRILVAGWPALAFLGGTLLTHGTTTAGATAKPVPALDELPLPEGAEPTVVPPVVEPAPPTAPERPDPSRDESAADREDVRPDAREPVVGTKRTGRRPAASMDELVEMVRPAVEKLGITQALVKKTLREEGIPISNERLAQLTQRLKDELVDSQAA
ncbi:DUF2637 domain-containing protein [Kitasatospora cineracea]|uniref:Uncharacterized protein DUF2637 n=1 Tax=Kitasatospora cineracea TaxID=88074 RepID=A0A8G1XAS2_9ACTN|nr:DUF2637 domain-containing protein [Kitasatospora cineracea]ROR43490.1 uncharacterized protein DUF2637 [Kitasatospora cineracea]